MVLLPLLEHLEKALGAARLHLYEMYLIAIDRYEIEHIEDVLVREPAASSGPIDTPAVLLILFSSFAFREIAFRLRTVHKSAPISKLIAKL